AQYPEAAHASLQALPADWWKLYADATLDQLVATAQQANADVRLAAARVHEAEGVLREARAAIFPDITGSYNYTRARVSTVASPPVPPGFPLIRPNHTLAASTNFEVDFWGRFSRATEAARASLLGAQYSRDTVQLSLAGPISSRCHSRRCPLQDFPPRSSSAGPTFARPRKHSSPRTRR